jgi:lysophospholipase L1-like esterase
LQRKIRSSDRTTAQVSKYAAAVRDLGSELSVPVLDIFSLVQALPPAERAAWSEDGVHPGPAGQSMVFQAVKGALESMVQFDDLR